MPERYKLDHKFVALPKSCVALLVGIKLLPIVPVTDKLPNTALPPVLNVPAVAKFPPVIVPFAETALVAIKLALVISPVAVIN